MTRELIDEVLNRIQSQEKNGEGNPRVKEIVARLLRDLFYAMDDLNITSEEMWHACDWLTQTGKNNEWGLVFAGLGIEHFIDVRMDWEDEQAGVHLKTPRTIEGPLYVAGSPESLSYAELENEPNQGDETLYMQGTVVDEEGNPVEGALVEVWHCNLKGLYSYFDSTQSEFNLRRAIRTGKDGRYQFKSFLPVGYSCPPNGCTDNLMKWLGRHGSRPAHIHFFVTAPNYRKLTTQINIDGDPLLGQDFAFADREELVPPITHYTAEQAKALGKDEAFASIDFDFNMVHDSTKIAPGENHRTRAAIVTA
ncbi:catechol 1,2-dioxygenase [Flavobacterium sp. NRK F10]|uniref:Catechol 1,2-dioxygenase n=1 Tax=Flavobacterium sediminis TaxID=2201181 RepID=A0A2U8QTX0_9FLAO|nr:MULTISPECIES: dioxygenase [Flavobacterium]AWM13632.1 catechol 1,2-dioxygenase [Flavobacterium sediminis]MCO6174754.1 catechol 1,2-dioxygenase [Flavobacterium sp. NRK F10]